jgi:competence protein ComEC
VPSPKSSARNRSSEPLVFRDWYLATKRISAVVEATGVWPVEEKFGWIGRVHRRTDVALGYGLRPQEAAVVRGMVLGDRSLIPEDLEEAFQRSGITHILPPFCTRSQAALPSAAKPWILRGRGGSSLANVEGTTSSYTFQLQSPPELLRPGGEELEVEVALV